MINSIDNRELQVYRPAKISEKKTEAVTSNTVSHSATQQGIVTQNKTDRVEISVQGRAAVSASQAATVNPQSLAEPTAKVAPQQAAPVSQEVAATAAAVESRETAAAVSISPAPTAEVVETSSAETNLVTLTEQQIKTLVSEGSVTQAEAQAEFARRAGTTEATAEAQPIQQTEQAVKSAEANKEAASDPRQQAIKMYSSAQKPSDAAVFSAVA